MTQNDPLLSGYFSIPAAAQLLNVSPSSVRGWLNGYSGSDAGPVVERDFEGTRAVSFLDLMELRFIAFFRKQKVSVATLRKAADRARQEWNVSHPLALSHEKYVTDRKNIFATSAEDTGDKQTWNLATGQHEMWITIEKTIQKGVMFDPVTHLATLWKPKSGEFPDVIIDPRIAFGKPVVQGTAVPTETLYRQWLAEDSFGRVAVWYDVPKDAVQIAVEYELEAA